MRRLILFLPVMLLMMGLSGCKTVQSSLADTTVIRDSVRFVDSVRIKDSIRIKDSMHVSHSVRDSVRIKDSTVVKVDTDGNVISKETWHDRDHYHTQSDSILILKAMFREALEMHKQDLERIGELQRMKQQKEVVVKEPTLKEKLEYVFVGFLMTLMLAVALFAFFRRQDE